MFWVYAIYHKKSNKIYIGQTCDYIKRLKEHNDPENNTHKYTGRFGVGWELVYKEKLETRQKALRREKQLKSYRGREFVKQYIPR